MTQTFFIPKNYSYVAFANKIISLTTKGRYIKQHKICGDCFLTISDTQITDFPDISKSICISELITKEYPSTNHNSSLICFSIRMNDLDTSPHPYEDITIKISQIYYPLHQAMLHTDQYGVQRLLLI